MRLTCFVMAAVLAAWMPSAFSQSDLLPRADKLIKSGKPAEALQLLQSASAANEQNPEYHYFSGIAALDDGQVDLGVTHLKQALRLKPDFAQAHAELGRAYLLQGDFLWAYFQFEQVKAANPPQEVLDGINKYVDQAHDSIFGQRKRFGGNLSIGFGYDSNVNSATSAQQVTLPILGGIVATLDNAGRAQNDTFTSLGANIGGFHPINESWELVGGAGGQAKLNSSVTNFDYTNLTTGGGIRYTSGPNQAMLLANYESLELDYKSTRNAYGMSVDLRRVIHPLVELSMFGQSQRLDYPQDPLRNVDRKVAGFALIPTAFGKRLYLPPVAAVYFGKEDPRESGVPYLGHDLWGARVGDLHIFNTRFTSFAGVSYENREYGGADPLFAVTRHDRQWDYYLGGYYKLAQKWTLIPSLSHTETNSNIETFKYRRTAVSLTANYSF